MGSKNSTKKTRISTQRRKQPRGETDVRPWEGGIFSSMLRWSVVSWRQRGVWMACIALCLGLSVWYWTDWCLWRADICLVLRDHSRAVTWIGRSRWSLRTASPKRCLLEIRLARRRGDYVEVQRKLQEADRIGVPRDEIHRERLLAMAQTNQFTEIQPYWSQLLRDPRDDEADIFRAYYTWAILRFDLKLAKATLKIWQENHPRDPEPWVLAGHYFMSVFDAERAEDGFRHALALDPNNTSYRLSLAEACSLQSAKTDQATALYREILQRQPVNVAAIRGLAECHLKKGDTQAALEALRKAITQHPDDLALHRTYGDILLAAGQFNEAAPELDRAYRVSPEDAKLAYSLARALKASGRVSESEPLFAFYAESISQVGELSALEHEIHVHPDSLEARMRIAAITAKYISRQDAIRWYKNLLRIAPEYRPAQQALTDLDHK